MKIVVYKHFVNGSRLAENSSLAFWNFLEFVFLNILNPGWLNQRMQTPWIQRAYCTLICSSDSRPLGQCKSALEIKSKDATWKKAGGIVGSIVFTVGSNHLFYNSRLNPDMIRETKEHSFCRVR